MSRSDGEDVAVRSHKASQLRREGSGMALATVDVRKARVPLRQAVAALSRCALRATRLLLTRQIRQPARHVGQIVYFANGTSSTVYRETVVDSPKLSEPAVLVVGFRLRHVHRDWAHALFRLESELNTVFFAGFAGFVSKLWLRDDEHQLYRGIYQWDRADLAHAYVRALWWVLVLVSERDSIHYAVLPGSYRDDLLDHPGFLGEGEAGGWWRPVQPEG